MRRYFISETTNQLMSFYSNLTVTTNGLIEISKEEYKRIQNLKLQINKLQHQLQSTDYKAIKYAEGLISEEDYKPIKEERISIRSQIKALEHVLDSISS